MRLSIEITPEQHQRLKASAALNKPSPQRSYTKMQGLDKEISNYESSEPPKNGSTCSTGMFSQEEL
jgi:hypothetical protein